MLSFINVIELEVYVGKESFCVVQHVMRRIPLILKKKQSAYGMLATVQPNTECIIPISLWHSQSKKPEDLTKNLFGDPINKYKESSSTIL